MSALSVDEIIEKVLINDRATYSREVKSKSVRESEQFQNYKLQEEN